MKKFKIIIDSMATYSQDVVKKLNLAVIPYSINDKDGNLIKDDFSDEQRDIVLRKIETGVNQKTSFVPGAIIEELIKPHLKEYDRVIYICAAEGYTGQFESAKVLMEKPEYKDKLWVVNSNSIASTIESLAIEIDELMNSNEKATYEDVVNLANDVANRSLILFSPQNVKGMLNSGRVPTILVKLMKLTKVHPLIKCEEKNKPTGIFTRKWDEIWTKICETLNKTFDNQLTGSNIKFLYLYNSLLTQEEIKKIKEKISQFFNFAIENIIVRSTPLPILVHVLRSSVGIGITTKSLYK